MEFIIASLLLYIMGCAFSLGAIVKLWSVPRDSIEYIGLFFLMAIWPLWWVIYLPYKLGMRVFG